MNKHSQKLRLVVGLLSLTLAAAGVDHSARAAAPVSPVGIQWDCVMSGAREGVALLEFSGDPLVAGDGTFTILEFLVPKPVNSADSESTDRGVNARGGGSTSTNTVAGTNLFGAGVSDGQWTYNSSGKIVGFFAESGESLIHPVSFTGKVSHNKLSLVATTPFGRVIYRGLPPSKDLPDVSGSWFGTKKDSGQLYNEIFSLTLASNNVYTVTGSGPGYTYDGLFMLTRQKKMGFVSQNTGTNEPLRAVTGPFDTKRFKFKAHGLDQRGDTIDNRVTFNAERFLNLAD
jgi:hypothetical protein